MLKSLLSCACLLFCVQPIGVSAAVPGVNSALTQLFLDYVRDLALPVGLAYLRNTPLPDPIASGDDASIKWSVHSAKINNVDAGLNVQLVAPNVISMSIFNLDLDISAKVSGREDIWPHPSVSVGADAKASGASATVDLHVTMNGDKPVVVLDSCSTHIDMHITISGLGILDPIGNLIISLFKSDIEDILKKEICDDVIKHSLVDGFLNPFLASFAFNTALPIAPPLDGAILDYHLTSAPVVVDTSAGHYLEVPVTGEVYASDGKHTPDAPAVLPKLNDTALGSHMVTGQLGPFPFNSILWTFWQQGVLTYGVHRDDVPADIGAVFGTEFYKTLIPNLYAKYPTQNMTCTLEAFSQPKVTIKPDNLQVSTNMTLTFTVPDGTMAFELWCPFQVTVDLSCKEPATVIGTLNSVNVVTHTASSPFGGVGAAFLDAMSVPVNGILNDVFIPLADLFLSKGFVLPAIHQDLGSFGMLDAAFVRLQVVTDDGFLLLGTDLQVTLTPTLDSDDKQNLLILQDALKHMALN